MRLRKSFLDLGFEPAAKPLRVRNDPAGIVAPIDALRRRGAASVALEATGPYAWPPTAALAAPRGHHLRSEQIRLLTPNTVAGRSGRVPQSREQSCQLVNFETQFSL